MSFLRTLLGDGQPRRNSFDTYLQLLQAFSWGGLTQTMAGQTTEEIESTFLGMAQGAYRTNGIVFACESVRLALFSEARFQFRRLRNGRPGDLFGTSALSILETPWAGGTTGDLLVRALLYHDLAGTAFVVRKGNELSVPRPDWMTIIAASRSEPEQGVIALDAKIIGYQYHPGGRGSGADAETLLPEQVGLFAGITPDPSFRFRGMPWMAAVLPEIMGDREATRHKTRFFENGATPNMIVSLDKDVTFQAYQEWKADFQKAEPRALDAYKTLYLGGGAKAEVVGANLQQMDFRAVQGAGETRIASAAGIHPVIVGISEGLSGSSLNAGNFTAARRLVADRTLRPLWRNFAGSMQTIVPPPGGSELWYDERDIPFLRDDAKDAAEIQGVEAQSIRTLLDAGFTADSVKAAILAQDWALLAHSKLFSVQLRPPGTMEPDSPDDMSPNGKTPMPEPARPA